MRVYFDQIYERIGWLFYAIASEKEKLTPSTSEKLQQIIDQQWKPTPDSDAMLQRHLLDYLKYGLRNAVDNASRPDEAFNRFRLYFELHSLPFSKDLRTRILATTRSIAAAFNDNDTNSDFINALEKVFTQNTPEKVIKQMT